MLLRDPGVQLMGLTVVTGDLWRDEAVAHALRGLELAGRTDVPVVPGAVMPLLNTEARTERWEALYGKLVWKGAWMRQWVEPTKQSAPHYHAPDVVPALPEGAPHDETTCGARSRVHHPHRARPSGRGHDHRGGSVHQHRDRAEPRSGDRRAGRGPGLYGRQPRPGADPLGHPGRGVRARVRQFATPRVQPPLRSRGGQHRDACSLAQHRDGSRRPIDGDRDHAPHCCTA